MHKGEREQKDRQYRNEHSQNQGNGLLSVVHSGEKDITCPCVDKAWDNSDLTAFHVARNIKQAGVKGKIGPKAN